MVKRFGMDVHVDAYAAQGTARRMCDNKGLKVSFDLSKDTKPFIYNNTVHVSQVRPSMSKDELNEWWGNLIHLTKHATPRGEQGQAVLKNADLEEGGIYEAIVSMAEDTVVDSIGVGEYLGQDETSSALSAKRWEGMTSNKIKSKLWEVPDLDEQSIVFGTMALTEGVVRQHYQPDMAGRENELLDNPKINSEIRERFERTISEGYADRLIELQNPERTAEEVYEWVQDWFKNIHNMPPPPPPNGGDGEGEDDGDGKQEGEDSSKEGPSTGGNRDKKAEEQKGQEDKGEDSKGDSEANQGNKPEDILGEHHMDASDTRTDSPMSENLKAIFEETERDLHKEIDLRAFRDFTNGEGLEIEYLHQGYSGKYMPAPPSHFIIVDYYKDVIVTVDGQQPPSDGYSRHDINEWKCIKVQDRPGKFNTHDKLSQEVKRYLQSETRTRVSRNKKKGKIDQRKLYKLGVSGASQDWQERVFWAKEHKLSVKETKVSLLCDISGSMHGSKITVAAQCMDLLGDVCNSLGIDYEMAGFTTDWSGSGIIHALYKPFGAKVQRSRILDNILGSTDHMAGNADGENVLYAYHRLLAQEAKRRVLIVLSDGQPASSGGDICKYTADVTAGIENAGRVELHGIGILTKSVKDYYKSYDVIKDVSMLEPTLLGVLKNTVIRIK